MHQGAGHTVKIIYLYKIVNNIILTVAVYQISKKKISHLSFFKIWDG